jgi:uracil-DNA glycosylase family 4
MIVGSLPGKIDEQVGKAYAGQPGQLLEQLLSQAGISRYECAITFACKDRPPGGSASFFFTNKQLTHPKPIMLEYLTQLKKEIEEVKPNVILTLGHTALWAVCNTRDLKNFRGSLMESTLVPGTKVIPTFSPNAINTKWEWCFPAVMDMRKLRNHQSYAGMPDDNRIIIENASLQEFEAYALELMTNPNITQFACDIETTPPNSHISRIGFSHNKNFGLSIPILNGYQPVMPATQETHFWQILSRLLTCGKKIIWQNGTYDILVIWKNNGILAFNPKKVKETIADTLVAAHVCWPESEKSLGFLASICLDVQAWKHDSKDYHGLYNAQDAMNTYGIFEVLEKEMETLAITHTYDMEIAQYPVAMMLQMRGIKVNEETRTRLIQEQEERLAAAEEALSKLCGKPINFNSPKQLIQLLYVDLGLPAQYKRRKNASDPRKMTTDEDALNHLSTIVDNPVLKLILECRKSYKLLGVIKAETSPEGTHHTSYNICKTETGRWSSSESIIFPYGSGNLQNITYYIRQMYESPIPNRVIIQADYIQAEAVDVAFRTNDQKLKGIFDRQEDLHAHTAGDMFGKPWTEIDPDGDERRIGKTLRHATNYSAGPAVVQVKLGCTLAHAKKLLNLYISVNPKLVHWQNEIVKKLHTDRTLINAFGRRRKFTGRLNDQLYRSAYAFLPQSDIGDLMNLSLTDIYENYGEELDLLLQLHDAMYIDTDPDPASVLKTMQTMSNCMYREVPLNGDTMVVKVDYSIGRNWGKQTKARINQGIVEIQIKKDGKKTWVPYKEDLI